MKTIRIKVSDSLGHSKILNVMAYPVEFLAIHADIEKKAGWTITHIPSGLCVVLNIPTYAQAKKIAQLLVNLDWKDKSIEELNKDKTFVESILKIKSAILELEGNES